MYLPKRVDGPATATRLVPDGCFGFDYLLLKVWFGWLFPGGLLWLRHGHLYSLWIVAVLQVILFTAILILGFLLLHVLCGYLATAWWASLGGIEVVMYRSVCVCVLSLG